MPKRMPEYMINIIKNVPKVSNEYLFDAVTNDYPNDEMDAYGHDSDVHSAYCKELEKRLIESKFLDPEKMGE